MANKFLEDTKVTMENTPGPYKTELFNLRSAISTYNDAVVAVGDLNTVAILYAKNCRNNVLMYVDLYKEAKRKANDLELTQAETVMLGIIEGIDQTFRHKIKGVDLDD